MWGERRVYNDLCYGNDEEEDEDSDGEEEVEEGEEEEEEEEEEQDANTPDYPDPEEVFANAIAAAASI